MKLGLKSTLGLFAGYFALIVAFALGLQTWLRSLEARLGDDTVRLIAREQANLVLERSLETLRYPDADSRRRLRERIRDLTLLSEVVSSLAVIAADGQVVESDDPLPQERFPTAREVLGQPPQARVDRLEPRSFLRGGDYVAYVPLTYGQELRGYLRIVLHSEQIASLYEQGRTSLMLLALLGLAGVGALGAFLQVQLARRAATITAVLEGRSPAPSPASTDEFAHALQAANRVKGALDIARRETERRGQQMGALTHLLKVGVVLLRRGLEVDHVSRRALEIVGSPDQDAFLAWWDGVRPLVGEAVKGGPGLDGSWSLRLSAPVEGGRIEAELHRLESEDCDDYLMLLRDPRALEALEADARLASQLEGLGRVYRTMAHELRAPLSAMMINLDLLRESLGMIETAEPGNAQSQRRYVDVLRDELNRLNRSLHGILTQTVPDAPEQQFDVVASLRHLATLLAPQARRQGIELRTDLGDNPLVMRGYPDRLRQAFLNITVNALEAMPRGGRLVIDTRRDDRGVTVTFADSGPGIPAEDLARIYEPDFSTKEGGSGIGLYVARALVELHGGEIRVESALDRGTRVLVSLPLAVNQS
jgi:signal transduction histidine kinase